MEMSNFEREVWLDALALAYEKGYVTKSKKEILECYWHDKLDENSTDVDYFDYDEAQRLIGGTA